MSIIGTILIGGGIVTIAATGTAIWMGYAFGRRYDDQLCCCEVCTAWKEDPMYTARRSGSAW